MSYDQPSSPLIDQHVLWLVIMSSDWSSCPLIGHHVLGSAIKSSDWSTFPLIGQHSLWLVNIPSDWSACPLFGHHVKHVNDVLMLQAECAILQMLTHLKSRRQTTRKVVFIRSLYRVFLVWRDPRKSSIVLPNKLTNSAAEDQWLDLPTLPN